MFSIACFKDVAMTIWNFLVHLVNRMLILSEQFTIGRWISLPHSSLLYSVRVRQSGEARLHWIPLGRGLFDARSYSNVVVSHDNTPFLGKVFGRIKFPWKRLSLLDWLS